MLQTFLYSCLLCYVHCNEPGFNDKVSRDVYAEKKTCHELRWHFRYKYSNVSRRCGSGDCSNMLLSMIASSQYHLLQNTWNEVFVATCTKTLSLERHHRLGAIFSDIYRKISEQSNLNLVGFSKISNISLRIG